ncbi:MAG TPA: hypothetical protein VJ690_02270 [Burkholderiales bacterium]|nr:hypothetical protein [Burkholderiales bacterium]
MSSHRTARVARVLSGALRLWEVSARVEQGPEGGFLVHARCGSTLRIAPGWLVFRDGELLATHAGLTGLLRTLRQELAPEAPRGRLIIGSR